MIHTGDIQPVQQQVGNAQHIGELLFLDAVDGIAVLIGIRRAFDLLLQLVEPADKKTAGAAAVSYTHLPDGHYTNTYFFKGGFAVRVWL